jgi:hypothetical protein
MAQVSHVQVFVDSRDLGGVQLGQADATPLAGASSATLQSQITGNRFRVLVDLPQNQFGLHSVFVYARSASTGREGIATTGVNIISNR